MTRTPALPAPRQAALRAAVQTAQRAGLRGAEPTLRMARRAHPTLRALGVLRSVEGVQVPAVLPPPLDAPRIGIDLVVRRLVARPAFAVLGVSVCVALGAHGALAVGSASLRPKRAHKERVVMTVAAAPVDEVLPEPLAPPPPPPPPPRSSASRAPAVEAARPGAPPSVTVPRLPLSSGGAGLGPLALGVGSGGADSASPAGDATPTPARAEPVVPPRPHSRSAPVYPHGARARGLEGRVVLSVLVDERGRVADVRVLESDPAGVFDDAALSSARGWTFTPATRGGISTSAWVRQVVRFSLR